MSSPLELPQSVYAFTEYTEEHLNQELADTWAEQRSFKHSEARTAQIGRKVAHLIFELNCRLQEELDNG